MNKWINIMYTITYCPSFVTVSVPVFSDVRTSHLPERQKNNTLHSHHAHYWLADLLYSAAWRRVCIACTLSPSMSFYRATLCASAVFDVAGCLSVRPSVTLVHSIHTAEFDSSFFDIMPCVDIQFRGRKIHVWWEKTWVSIEIAVYFGNGAR